MFPAIAQVVHLRAKLDGDLLRRDPDVGLEEPEPAAPLPHVPIQTAVKLTDEAIGQDVAESECARTKLVQQR